MLRRQIMTNTPLWLPELVLFNDFKGDWDSYLNAVYGHFKQDFIDNTTYFEGTRIALKKHPTYQDKEYVFWHVTSEGKEEDQRTPDFRRCERIRWIRPIIENPYDPGINFWENTRKNDHRICLWLESENYLVILAKRTDYILLWTAYLVNSNHTKNKLRKEYENYKALKP